MKLRYSPILLALTLSAQLHAAETAGPAVDYSRCMDYINAPYGGFNGIGTGFGLLPIRLQADGSIQSFGPAVKNHRSTDEADIVEFETPRMGYPTQDRTTGQMIPGEIQQRRMQVVITKDERGRPASIRIEDPITQQEINTQLELSRSIRDSMMSDEQKAHFEELAERFDWSTDPFFSHASAHVTNFNIRNNTCVVDEAVTEILTEPKVGGRTQRVPQFNTELCRDLHDFIQNNPDAAACFRSNLNSSVDRIFSKYRAHYSGDNFNPGIAPYGVGAYGGFGGGPIGMGMGVGGMGMGSIGAYAPTLTTELHPMNSEVLESSPVIRANRLLGLCRNYRLEPFYTDETIWQRAQGGGGGNSTEGGEGGSRIFPTLGR